MCTGPTGLDPATCAAARLDSPVKQQREATAVEHQPEAMVVVEHQQEAMVIVLQQRATWIERWRQTSSFSAAAGRARWLVPDNDGGRTEGALHLHAPPCSHSVSIIGSLSVQVVWMARHARARRHIVYSVHPPPLLDLACRD